MMYPIPGISGVPIIILSVRVIESWCLVDFRHQLIKGNSENMCKIGAARNGFDKKLVLIWFIRHINSSLTVFHFDSVMMKSTVFF